MSFNITFKYDIYDTDTYHENLIDNIGEKKEIKKLKNENIKSDKNNNIN